MSNVVPFPGQIEDKLREDENPATRCDPKAVLLSATNQEFNDILVIGRKTNGTFFIASSTNDIGKLLIFLEGTKSLIVDQIDVNTED